VEFRQRNYNVEGQLGQEKSSDYFVERLAMVFEEVHRVLKPSGSCFVVIADSFKQTKSKKYDPDIPKGSLYMVPERFAELMIRWNRFCLRGKIIWKKGNAIPQSAQQRIVSRSIGNIFSGL
jgi:site-specific DNA-methyltransferase (adenine-specific)